jgi:putative solute:sodium symporter small subunit
MAAQGCLIALVILAFIFAREHDAIDVEDGGTERQARSGSAES